MNTRRSRRSKLFGQLAGLKERISPLLSSLGALSNRNNPSSNQQLVMDSLPQEIIDEIIDNLPRSCLRSSSLVARRWRKRSQQRVFSTILFRTESTVKSWYTNVQSDPGGASSYVKFGIFACIDKWTDSALFGRVLGNFNSLTELGIADTGIPDEVLEGVLQGELGGITALHLVGLRCSLPMMISIIVAFPNLQDLTINDLTIAPREGPSTGPLPRRLLGLLCVHGGAYGAVTEALVNHRFASRKLTLDAQPRSIQKLLILSSATIVELVLIGVYSLCVDRKIIMTALQMNRYWVNQPPTSSIYHHFPLSLR